MVPIHSPRVRNMSRPSQAGNTAATTAEFNFRGRNLAQVIGNTAPLAWLS
ncbi:hypothetical protein BJQ89_02523 [Arthrobacter sp. ES1]|nr:hypothetical protein [Arthrobacter sp. ES1]